MTLLADALSNTAPAVRPPATPDTPDWPLLQALSAPAAPLAPREEATLVRLFGGPPAPVAPQPFPLPAQGAPAPAAGRPGGTWAAPAPAPAPAPALAPAAPPAAAGLLPADRVGTPLADIFQSLAQGGPAPASPFAALRLPGGAPGFR